MSPEVVSCIYRAVQSVTGLLYHVLCQVGVSEVRIIPRYFTKKFAIYDIPAIYEVRQFLSKKIIN